MSSFSYDHRCSSQLPLDQSAHHNASGVCSQTTWPTLLRGSPLQVNMLHPHGQLQCIDTYSPATGWVPNLLQASPPLSVPPGHPRGLQGLPPVTALGLTQASQGRQLPCFSSGPCLALLPSVKTKQAPPMKPPLQAGGVRGAPRVLGTFPPSSMGRVTSFVSLPSGGSSLLVS